MLAAQPTKVRHKVCVEGAFSHRVVRHIQRVNVVDGGIRIEGNKSRINEAAMLICLAEVVARAGRPMQIVREGMIEF